MGSVLKFVCTCFRCACYAKDVFGVGVGVGVECVCVNVDGLSALYIHKNLGLEATMTAFAHAKCFEDASWMT